MGKSGDHFFQVLIVVFGLLFLTSLLSGNFDHFNCLGVSLLFDGGNPRINIWMFTEAWPNCVLLFVRAQPLSVASNWFYKSKQWSLWFLCSRGRLRCWSCMLKLIKLQIRLCVSNEHSQKEKFYDNRIKYDIQWSNNEIVNSFFFENRWRYVIHLWFGNWPSLKWCAILQYSIHCNLYWL